MILSAMSWFGLSECCLCGWCTRVEPPFCGYCWQRAEVSMLKSMLKPQWRRVENLPVLSLWDWNSSNEELGRKTLYHLKESRSVRTFTSLMARLVGELPSDIWADSLLVPIPSSTGRFHSKGMAQAMSELCGRPVFEALRLTDGLRQPGRSKAERKRRSFKVCDLDLLQNYRAVILLDDVVTSGASMIAAKQACLEANSTLVHVLGVTVFHRSLSTSFA